MVLTNLVNIFQLISSQMNINIIIFLRLLCMQITCACNWIPVAIGCGTGLCLHNCNLISLLSYRCVQAQDSFQILWTHFQDFTDVYEQTKRFMYNISSSYICSFKLQLHAV